MNLKERAKKLKSDIPAVFIALKDKDTPLLAKIVAGITVGYALSPIDLVPDFIPVLGYLDDIILLPALVALTIKLIPKDVWAKSKERAEDLWRDGKPKKMVLLHSRYNHMGYNSVAYCQSDLTYLKYAMSKLLIAQSYFFDYVIATRRQQGWNLADRLKNIERMRTYHRKSWRIEYMFQDRRYQTGKMIKATGCEKFSVDEGSLSNLS